MFIVYKPIKGSESVSKREAEKQAKLEQQAKNLQIIADTAAYLDNLLRQGLENNVKMKDILDYLTERGYSADDTKVVSQFNYILMDLCNAQKNPKNEYKIQSFKLFEKMLNTLKDQVVSILCRISCPCVVRIVKFSCSRVRSTFAPPTMYPLMLPSTS